MLNELPSDEHFSDQACIQATAAMFIADSVKYNSQHFLSLQTTDTLILKTPGGIALTAIVSRINSSKYPQVIMLFTIIDHPDGFLSLTTCGNAFCGLLSVPQLQLDYQLLAEGDGGSIRFIVPDYFGKIRNRTNSIPSF